MNKYRCSGHTLTRLTVRLVWVTKYRHKVLAGDIQERCRELLIQICNAADVWILNRVVSKDHIHMHTDKVVEEYLKHRNAESFIRCRPNTLTRLKWM